MTNYRISAREMGKNCDFQAEAPTSEEAVRKAVEHAKSCSVCSGLNEEQAKANIKEVQ